MGGARCLGVGSLGGGDVEAWREGVGCLGVGLKGAGSLGGSRNEEGYRGYGKEDCILVAPG